jgi:hypothetical protein
MAGSDPKPAALRMLRFEIAMAPGASAHWRASAFRSSDKFSRIFQNLDLIRTPGERRRGGDNGVDLLGIIERAPDHQRFGDCQSSRAMLGDQRLASASPNAR